MKICLFVGRRSRLVLREGTGALPTASEALSWGFEDSAWFEVEQGEVRVLAGYLDSEWEPPSGVVTVGLRASLAVLNEPDLSVGLTAAHFVRWRRTSRYCGVCGEPTVLGRSHRAMECSGCGHLTFPKVSPAVIVQVTRGDQILLGRSRRHPAASYSVLAGFVDPGESLEDAVRREILEESGIQVTNIRYFGSQPWPFPDSLMVGFTAEYEGGVLENRDEELEEVGWYDAHDLPPVPPTVSIARALIDDFARGRGVDPASIPTWSAGR